MEDFYFSIKIEMCGWFLADQEMKERTVFVTARSKIRTNVRGRRRRRGEDESQKRKSVGSGKLRLRFKLLTSYFAEPPPLRRDLARFIPEAHCFWFPRGGNPWETILLPAMTPCPWATSSPFPANSRSLLTDTRHRHRFPNIIGTNCSSNLLLTFYTPSSSWNISSKLRFLRSNVKNRDDFYKLTIDDFQINRMNRVIKILWYAVTES